MQLLQTADFASQADTTFALSLGESAMDLTLVEIKPLPVRPYPGMLRHPFSLTFRSAAKVVLPQRIYRLKNATAGVLDVFLVPVGRDAQGVLYEAVFN